MDQQKVSGQMAVAHIAKIKRWATLNKYIKKKFGNFLIFWVIILCLFFVFLVFIICTLWFHSRLPLTRVLQQQFICFQLFILNSFIQI